MLAPVSETLLPLRLPCVIRLVPEDSVRFPLPVSMAVIVGASVSWPPATSDTSLFGALVNGTSTRGLDPTVFPPQLAGNLTLMIQALVLLFVGADVLILYLWQGRKKLGFGRKTGPSPQREVAA